MSLYSLALKPSIQPWNTANIPSTQLHTVGGSYGSTLAVIVFVFSPGLR
mgnify:CR=1 FL=1